MGRPPTKPIRLKDGFYIEVRNKGANSGIKIHRESEEKMMRAAKEFLKSKDVVLIGEVKNGKMLQEKKKLARDTFQS